VCSALARRPVLASAVAPVICCVLCSDARDGVRSVAWRVAQRVSASCGAVCAHVAVMQRGVRDGGACGDAAVVLADVFAGGQRIPITHKVDLHDGELEAPMKCYRGGCGVWCGVCIIVGCEALSRQQRLLPCCRASPFPRAWRVSRRRFDVMIRVVSCDV
jgi:hypothetical protein